MTILGAILITIMVVAASVIMDSANVRRKM